MKTKYQKPVIEVIDMQAQQMLCYSGELNAPLFGNNDENEEV